MHTAYRTDAHSRPPAARHFQNFSDYVQRQGGSSKTKGLSDYQTLQTGKPDNLIVLYRGREILFRLETAQDGATVQIHVARTPQTPPVQGYGEQTPQALTQAIQRRAIKQTGFTVAVDGTTSWGRIAKRLVLGQPEGNHDILLEGLWQALQI